MPALLEVSALAKRFGGVTALDGVSFEIGSGEIVGIIGPNGSGKTTLLNVVTGHLRPSGGEVVWRGTGITGTAPHRVAKLGIGRTFQQATAFPALSVRENLAIALQHARRADGGGLGFSSPAEVADFVGLSEVVDQRASGLPFGLLRRLGVGLALAGRPLLIMLDEPAAGLNDRETEDLRDLLLRCRGAGTTIAIVDHDMNLMMALCDRLVVLDFGQKVAEGTPEDIRNDEQVLAVYLGAPVDTAT